MPQITAIRDKIRFSHTLIVICPQAMDPRLKVLGGDISGIFWHNICLPCWHIYHPKGGGSQCAGNIPDIEEGKDLLEMTPHATENHVENNVQNFEAEIVDVLPLVQTIDPAQNSEKTPPVAVQNSLKFPLKISRRTPSPVPSYAGAHSVQKISVRNGAEGASENSRGPAGGATRQSMQLTTSLEH